MGSFRETEIDGKGPTKNSRISKIHKGKKMYAITFWNLYKPKTRFSFFQKLICEPALRYRAIFCLSCNWIQVSQTVDFFWFCLSFSFSSNIFLFVFCLLLSLFLFFINESMCLKQSAFYDLILSDPPHTPFDQIKQPICLTNLLVTWVHLERAIFKQTNGGYLDLNLRFWTTRIKLRFRDLSGPSPLVKI